MANRVRIKATKDDFEKAGQDQGDFVLPPKGYYVMQLKECNPGFSKDDDGNEDKSRPRLECVWVITGVGTEDAPAEENYMQTWDYVTFGESSGWKRGQFLKAIGASDGTADFDGEIDVDEVLGTKIIGRIGHKRGQSKDDGYRTKLQSMIPYEDRDVGAAFGEAAEAEADEEAEGDYTEEELLGMEPKELGSIAKDEFELDPTTFIVKARGKVNVDKSKAKLVAAILEAQETDEEGEGEGGSDNPF